MEEVAMKKWWKRQTYGYHGIQRRRIMEAGMSELDVRLLRDLIYPITESISHLQAKHAVFRQDKNYIFFIDFAYMQGNSKIAFQYSKALTVPEIQKEMQEDC